ncbi:MAG: hypothetical protein E5Y85_09675 [Mesorhizobium sp.]|nr:MAG: hypothetical protein E5Y85_09675 [Mesorhizobium sp.]TIM48649.1 MAG: hypothetical protein E5Y56_06685 [Mesorhizobium sp.]
MVKGSAGSGPNRSCPAGPSRRLSATSLVFLHAHGIGTARAARIYRMYGAKAVKIMCENPHRLAKARGIGFCSADQISQRLV